MESNKESLVLCGTCGTELVEISTSAKQRYFCPQCNEFPSSITYCYDFKRR
jgi:phage FluMu protein Com